MYCRNNEKIKAINLKLTITGLSIPNYTSNFALSTDYKTVELYLTSYRNYDIMKLKNSLAI